MENLKPKKSKTLTIGTILGVLYSLYLIFYFFGETASANSPYETLGARLAITMVMPHIICIVIGAVFSVVAYVSRKRWAGLVAFIMYYVACVMFPLYAFFSLPIAIIATIGWVRMKKYA